MAEKPVERRRAPSNVSPGDEPKTGTDLDQSDEQRRAQEFVASLLDKRKEAVNFRKNSGIEEIWEADNDAFEGYDDANRDERMRKPQGHQGSTEIQKVVSETRSTVFLNITRPYCENAAARVGDMLLPTDDKPWGVEPTPMPDLVQQAMNDIRPAKLPDGRQIQQPVVDAGGEPVMDQATGEQKMRGMQVRDFAREQMRDAEAKAEKAEKQIEDWLVECQWHSEVRKVIDDAARIGTGVLKGPNPVLKRARAVALDEAGKASLQIMEKIAPTSKEILANNLFPDPACGENIHDGGYIWERDLLTKRKLAELAENEDYDAESILACLREGPQKKVVTGEHEPATEDVKENDNYEIWYYHGFADKEDFEACGCELEEEEADKFELMPLPVVVEVVNDRPIKMTLAVMDSGAFPYDVFVWQRRKNSWAGYGIAHQVSVPQRMLNAACRHMMDNAGLGAGFQLIINQGAIEPADGSWSLQARKVWLTREDATTQEIDKAFKIETIPIQSKELMEIIQFALQRAEDLTGLPMLLQGQHTNAPDAVGALLLLHNNASAVLRRLARTFDDRITEPHIGRYYEWLLIYGENEEAKGDFVIDAKGSSALVERALQSMELQAMGALVAQPNNPFGIDPEKWMEEYMKSRRVDPKRLQYSDEKKEAMAQSPAMSPDIIKAKTQVQGAQMKAQSDRELAEADRAHDLMMAQINRETELIKLAQAGQIKFEELKAMLTRTAIDNSTKREVAAGEMALKMHPDNPTNQGI